ncbi:MAG: hypothetical protein JKX84_11480 [Flavobacteriales bacterium]|nr:hypothetical protein [Flavobacteriales bacterium]
MPKNPLIVVVIALMLVIGINSYYFATSNDLTTVVTRTLFADLLLVLSMVPIYESIRIKLIAEAEPLPMRIKEGLKPVLIYTLFLALTTYILFKLFGDPLIGDRISQLRQMLDAAPEMSEELKQQKL